MAVNSTESFKEMLELQTTEIEMLQSMFSNSGEFVLDDECALTDIRSYLDGKSEYDALYLRLGFTLQLTFDDKGHLEVVCHLPHEYPNAPPEIYLRSQSLSRPQHRLLTDALQSYIMDDLQRGELCLGFITQWLQDNTEVYFAAENVSDESTSGKQSRKEETIFSRMWIYSHHIYSKVKRKDILDFSEELQLTGFTMPGKPGIICIEGYNSSVETFWHRIRRMQWKRLVMKEKEDFEIRTGQSVDDLRKFEGFEEKIFEPRQGKGRGAHSDRGLLFQFLEQHDCGQIFPIYFGVEGRTVDEDSS